MTEQLRLMIVDDEKPMLEWLSILLEQHGYDVSCYSRGEDALRAAMPDPPDVAVVDVKMPGMSGLELLEKLRERSQDIIGIVMTAFSSVDSAVDAIRKGASDYLIKPFEVDQLLVAIEKAQGERILRRENRDLRQKVRTHFSMKGIIGKSRPMVDLLEKVRMVADKESTVLISGESGTGKELIARALHYHSSRSDRPFLGVNCGSFSRNLLESELFGHVKGSFTGAHRDKEGLLVAASGGTFFLDEVGELDRELQVKLLRALQERQVLPVGGTKHIPFDARLVAATNADLKSMVDGGDFRTDLYYRLNVIPLHVPPLRERRSDVPLLVEKFLEDFARENGVGARTVTDEAMDVLKGYDWPGNVRELENVIERVCVMSGGSAIDIPDLPDFLTEEVHPSGEEPEEEAAPARTHGALKGDGEPPTLQEIEKAYTMYVLEHRAGGQKRLAAKLLGINESTLHRRLERYARDGTESGG